MTFDLGWNQGEWVVSNAPCMSHSLSLFKHIGCHMAFRRPDITSYNLHAWEHGRISRRHWFCTTYVSVTYISKITLSRIYLITTFRKCYAPFQHFAYIWHFYSNCPHFFAIFGKLHYFGYFSVLLPACHVLYTLLPHFNHFVSNSHLFPMFTTFVHFWPLSVFSILPNCSPLFFHFHSFCKLLQLFLCGWVAIFRQMWGLDKCD